MQKDLIQEFYNSIEPRFEIILNSTNIEGNKNPIFWKINVKTFSDNFEQFAKQEIRVDNYEIMNYVNLIKLVNAKTIKLHILIFTYFNNDQPAHLKTQIDLKYQELIDYLEHLKGLKLDIINLSRNDFKLANKIKTFLIQGIAELKNFFNSQFIKLEFNPLNNNFNQIIKDYKEAIDIQDISIEVELLKITNSNSDQEKSDTQNNKKDIPFKIALLHELGFFELPEIKKLTKKNQRKIISRLIEGSDRFIEGNISVLNPNSNEDTLRFTAVSKMQDAKTFLSALYNN